MKQKIKKGDKIRTGNGNIETVLRINSNGNIETIENDYSHNPNTVTPVNEGQQPDMWEWWGKLTTNEKQIMGIRHLGFAIDTDRVDTGMLKTIYRFEFPEQATNEGQQQPEPKAKDMPEGLNDEDVNTILAALIMAKTRYNTTDNGGMFYDFTFANIEKQNEYAQNFEDVEMKVRTLFVAK